MGDALERLVPGLVGLALFGAPTLYLIFLAALSVASRRWPTAAGRVTTSNLITGRRGAAYYDVRYEYVVDGETYRGDRVRFGGALNGNSRDAADTRSTYPVGRPVEVRYHPGRPGWSTLETRASNALWLWIGLGVLMAFPIAGALLGFWD
jgi:hypothetical protein